MKYLLKNTPIGQYLPKTATKKSKANKDQNL